MAQLSVTEAFFDRVTDPVGIPWRLRVVISGEGLVDRAAPMTATVGDVPVYVHAVTGSGTVVGFLEEEPADGAKLSIGYADTGLVETDVVYTAPPVA